MNADYGGQAGKIGYYAFIDGFRSDRYLDPPEPRELHDFGQGARGPPRNWTGTLPAIA